MMFKDERQEYPPEKVVQHLSLFLSLVIQPHLRHIVVLDWNRLEINQYEAVC
jgi:hypothetical protein